MSAVPFVASRRAALACLVAACTLPPVALAATKPGEPKDVALRLTATGTVVAVDPAARRLTLKGQRHEASYRVDPKVGNLDEVRVGQKVRIDYVAALVLTLRRGAQAPQPAEAPASAAPGAGAVVPGGTTVTTHVLAVDRKAQSVRLKGPEGRVADFRVQDPADLVGVRAGDQVTAVLHEAVVVGLEPLAN